MTIETALIARAKAHPACIVLPEGEDPRIIAGALQGVEAGLCTAVLLGNRQRVAVASAGLDLTRPGIELLDPAAIDPAPYLEELMTARHGKISPESAAEAVRDPLVLAALMVRMGEVDGTVGGAVNTTADTVRTALQIIGKAPGARLVSSFFLMELKNGRLGQPELVIFADCGLVVDPNPRQLADIAVASAASFEALADGTPHVAMLSFSTKGSANHSAVDKVTEALGIVQSEAPELLADGELQFDAAFDDAVGRSKAPDSTVAGTANVFVFPNLDAGNIGYKIAQRVGGAVALGPILQGLARPANDLSRGCSADDVFKMIAVTVNQVRLAKNNPV